MKDLIKKYKAVVTEMQQARALRNRGSHAPLRDWKIVVSVGLLGVAAALAFGAYTYHTARKAVQAGAETTVEYTTLLEEDMLREVLHEYEARTHAYDELLLQHSPGPSVGRQPVEEVEEVGEEDVEVEEEGEGVE